jgi:D-amino peptidase
MRVHVISDMEGVSGIVKGPQTAGGKPLYDEGRRLYTEEINAAVRGAKAAGADEIVVMDCHDAGEEWSFNSLVPDLLDPACEFVVQEDWTGTRRSSSRAVTRRSSSACTRVPACATA